MTLTGDVPPLHPADIADGPIFEAELDRLADLLATVRAIQASREEFHRSRSCGTGVVSGVADAPRTIDQPTARAKPDTEVPDSKMPAAEMTVSEMPVPDVPAPSKTTDHGSGGHPGEQHQSVKSQDASEANAEDATDEDATDPTAPRAGAVIARLRAVDETTGDCFLYETTDEAGNPSQHPWLAIHGHDLCLARDFDENEVPNGPITLHLSVTDAGDNLSRESLTVDLKAWFAREWKAPVKA